MILNLNKSILNDLEELRFLIAMYGYTISIDAITHIDSLAAVANSGIMWGYNDFDAFTWLVKTRNEYTDSVICTFTHSKNFWPFQTRRIIVIHNIVSSQFVTTHCENLAIVKKEDSILVIVPEIEKFQDTYVFRYYNNTRTFGFEEFKDYSQFKVLSEGEYNRYYLKAF
jgi:hypothetical protein